MNTLIIVIAALLLILHGLIHLMGTTVYMKLGQIQGLPFGPRVATWFGW